MTIQTKICGLKNLIDIKTAIDNGADFLGFIFFPQSPRNISTTQAHEINTSNSIPESVKKVAVTVNASDTELDNIVKSLNPDIIQLHGSESPNRAKEIKDKYNLPIIKAIAVRTGDDVAISNAYSDICNYILFDAKAPNSSLPGGNGLQFDWNLLKSKKFAIPWFLSGGLNQDNIIEAINVTGSDMVDLSSSLESEPGVKDPELIKKFLKIVKNL